MHNVNPFDLSRIAQDLQIRKLQVECVVQLLEEGNSVPFIACYRKEKTGGLNEDIIRHIAARVRLQKQLAERKQTMAKSIENQGKMTDDLRAAILHAETSKRLDDLYLPFKPRKPGPASEARARGLEPLAQAIAQRDAAFANIDDHWQSFVNPDKQLNSIDEVRAGVLTILAEMIAEKADVRAAVRRFLWENGGIISAKSEKMAEGQGLEYKDYFEFAEALRHIPPHRILALNRGEKEHALKVSIDFNRDDLREAALHALADAGLRRPRRRREHGRRDDRDAPHDASETAPTESHAESGAEMQPHGEPAAAHPAPIDMVLTGAEVQQPPNTFIHQGDLAAPTPAMPEFQALPPEVGEPLSPHSEFRTPHAELLKTALDDALTRLLLPALEREIRQELTDESEAHSVTVLARNLRSLLLQPPLRNQRVLAIDPSFRTGCTVVALDETGGLLEHSTIYPSMPHRGPREKPRGKPRKPRKDKRREPAGAAVTSPAAVPAVPETREVSPWASAAELPPPPPPPPVSGGQPDELDTAAVATEPAVNLPVNGQDNDATTTSTAVADAPAPMSEAHAEASPETSTPPGAESPVAEPTAATPPPAPEPPRQTPAERRAEAKSRLAELAKRNQTHIIAIGNGNGCRETEELVSELIAEGMPELAYVIVNEAGARVYSVSQPGRDEFPNADSSVRGTISIGRRLQDPLSELVKVDPQHIGVGLYQHDVKRRELKEMLEGVVESVVNQVGIDVNSANGSLLRYVAGLNPMLARELVEYRKANGPFKNRQQLLQVPGMSPARFAQAAGFLKILDGDNPLDRTWIHPESYELAGKILGEIGYGPDVLLDGARQQEFNGKLKALNVPDLANRLNAGEPTVYDIIQALLHPSRDPREELPPPVFKKGILKLEDLQAGMELKGTVLNVVDFGVFVDIGLKESGLVHISQMANRYIKSPYDVVSVNDVVSAWVINVDKERHRVSLTMIKPGTERKPGERRPSREDQPRQRDQRDQQRPPQGDRRPPQGDRRPPQGDRRPPQQGDRRRPPGQQQGRPGGPRPGQSGGQEPAAARPAPPPPKPRTRRPVPQPKLSKAALEGKVPLRTFGELSALFAAKKEDPKPSEQPTPAASSEAPPPAASEAVTQPAPETAVSQQGENPHAAGETP